MLLYILLHKLKLTQIEEKSAFPDLKTDQWFNMLVALKVVPHFKKGTRKLGASPDDSAWDEMHDSAHEVVEGKRGTEH